MVWVGVPVGTFPTYVSRLSATVAKPTEADHVHQSISLRRRERPASVICTRPDRGLKEHPTKSLPDPPLTPRGQTTFRRRAGSGAAWSLGR
jgi:hypothetical protein